MFAKKVNKHDAKLHQIVEDMQSRIAKFRESMSGVEPELNRSEIKLKLKD